MTNLSSWRGLKTSNFTVLDGPQWIMYRARRTLPQEVIRSHIQIVRIAYNQCPTDRNRSPAIAIEHPTVIWLMHIHLGYIMKSRQAMLY